MTEPAYLSIGGQPAQSIVIDVPAIGAWFASAVMVDAAPSGRALIKIGDNFTALGTIDPQRTGGFAGETRTRLVGGAGAWGVALAALPYRNDAGVSASLVAQDAAAACGETLADFAGGQLTLGAKYIRQAGPASRTLEDAARGAAWWVDFAGKTHVGTRPAAATPARDTIQLLEYDPELEIATLNVDDLTQVGIGTVLSDERLDSSKTIAAYRIEVTHESTRVLAWCGAVKQSALVDVLRAIILRATDLPLFGRYRYRVTTLSADRVNVQAISKTPGLPDILSLDMGPGVAGAHATLALGAIVFVEFVAGDRADPVITGFTGRGGTGFVPQFLTIGASDDSAPFAARLGDKITVPFPLFNFVGTLSGSPISGVMTPQQMSTDGTITGASAKVRIG